MIIAIDFDGTVVRHKYPEIGESVGAEDTLRSLTENGHKIILLTMRGHSSYNGRDLLQEAINWFEERNIELWAINENPEQSSWTNSSKVYANLYIDDSALGCPKTLDEHGTIIVDWNKINHWLKACGLINTVIL